MPKSRGRGRPRRPPSGPATRQRSRPDDRSTDPRQSFEQASLGPAAYLNALPRWLLLIITLALVLVGLFVRGPGGSVALLLVAAVLGWLAALSWPRLTPGLRLGRVVVMVVVVAAAGWQLGR